MSAVLEQAKGDIKFPGADVCEPPAIGSRN